MKSFDTRYPKRLRIPLRLITTIRQIGDLKGTQELYKQHGQREICTMAKSSML
jgi:hypothetical protein